MLKKFLNISFTRKDVAYLFMIVISALLYAVGMQSFVKSGNLYPGGFAGIARLVSISSHRYLHVTISFGAVYFLLNLIVTVFIWKRIGHKFVLYSFIWYTLSSIFIIVIKLPHITQDMLLVSVFGGLINGVAIGIALRSNASSGGTDFIAMDLSRRLHKSTWNYMLGLNAVVLVIAGISFGWKQALYSIIFQYVSTTVVNGMYQRFKVCRLEIITDSPDEVREVVFEVCHHGITKVSVEGAYRNARHSMLITSINAFQVNSTIDAIKRIDPKAFISVSQVERIVGNYYQKPIE